MTLRFLSLFSGIEAASVAWNPLGWSAVGFSEIEPFPCAVLAHHYPHVPNLGDVSKITREQVNALGSIDIVCGGFPCQDLSVAGKRKGFSNADGSSTRSGLFFDAMRVAGWANPRWLVIENVPGLFSSSNGADFASVVGEMAGCEFDVPPDGWRNTGVAVGPRGLVEWATLDAQWFGVPQRRRRVFLVRDSGDWRDRSPVLFERHSLSGHPAPRRQVGQRPTGTLSARTEGGGGLGIDFECSGGVIETLCIATGQAGAEIGADMAPTLNCNHEAPYIAHSLRGEGFDASEDGTGRGTPLIPVAFDTTQITNAANRSNPQPGDPCHTLSKGAHAPAVAFDCKASGQNGFGIGEIASTQRAMGHANSHTNGGGHQAVMTAMQVRRLTPRECERLQGFPDDYTLIPLHQKKPTDVLKFSADGPRYKALGNSWAVPCATWIGRRIEAVALITQEQAAIENIADEVTA